MRLTYREYSADVTLAPGAALDMAGLRWRVAEGGLVQESSGPDCGELLAASVELTPAVVRRGSRGEVAAVVLVAWEDRQEAAYLALGTPGRTNSPWESAA